MDKLPTIPRYGVNEQTNVADAIDLAAEQLRLVGFAIVDPGFSEAEKAHLSNRFDSVAETYFDQNSGRAELAKIDEHNTVRAMLTMDNAFFSLAKSSIIIALCEKLMGSDFILNQQNGIINPAKSEGYSQSFYHRDLPYQHFVSTRPLAINALYCVDTFTIENGATKVVPGSHKQEAFPADASIRALETAALAPAGSFIVLDGMVFHAGGRNDTDMDRRAVNHVYTLPFVKQQICLESLMGNSDGLSADDKRLLDFGNQPASDTLGFFAVRRAKLAKRAEPAQHHQQLQSNAELNSQPAPGRNE